MYSKVLYVSEYQRKMKNERYMADAISPQGQRPPEARFLDELANALEKGLLKTEGKLEIKDFIASVKWLASEKLKGSPPQEIQDTLKLIKEGTTSQIFAQLGALYTTASQPGIKRDDKLADLAKKINSLKEFRAMDFSTRTAIRVGAAFFSGSKLGGVGARISEGLLSIARTLNPNALSVAKRKNAVDLIGNCFELAEEFAKPSQSEEKKADNLNKLGKLNGKIENFIATLSKAEKKTAWPEALNLEKKRLAEQAKSLQTPDTSADASKGVGKTPEPVPPTAIEASNLTGDNKATADALLLESDNLTKELQKISLRSSEEEEAKFEEKKKNLQTKIQQFQGSTFASNLSTTESTLFSLDDFRAEAKKLEFGQIAA